MSSESFLQRVIREHRDDPDYILEGLLLDLNEQIVSAMERAGLSRSELARKLGRSRAYVTQLLNGKPNLTLKTLVAIACALGGELSVGLQPQEDVAVTSPELDLRPALTQAQQFWIQCPPWQEPLAARSRDQRQQPRMLGAWPNLQVSFEPTVPASLDDDREQDVSVIATSA